MVVNTHAIAVLMQQLGDVLGVDFYALRHPEGKFTIVMKDKKNPKNYKALVVDYPE